jgi:hypothetical protein
MSTAFASLANDAQSTLAADYTASSGTLTLASGYGATLAAALTASGFPAVSSAAPLRFTLIASGQSTGPAYKATSLSGDVLGGVAVAEGSDADFPAGSTFAVLMTAGHIAELQAAVNALEETYVFAQDTPASTWTVAHNLGRFPSVSVVDSAGTAWEGDVTYDSADQLTIRFRGGFSGKAYLN